MLFNSLEFVIFFVLVGGLYAVLQHRPQNVLLLIASLVFYGWWDWRFLFLLSFAIVVDFNSSHQMVAARTLSARRFWLCVSMCSNLGILGFFKYYNFFAESTARVLRMAGIEFNAEIAGLILPVGISFYTFQTMSYVIDVYRGDLKPARTLADFALFVCFFPQLVAGPIERATVLLPQVEGPRQPKYQQLRDGFRLILLGYILKLVVAENMAPFVRELFEQPQSHHGWNVLFGLYAAAFQIYGDFAGYSSIARGLAKLMGFELMPNFRQPYLAMNPSDFWRRWHISLSKWLRDYLYIPLGGNRGSEFATYRNLMLTMLLGGLWHGAALNFVAWGLFHGGILCVHRLVQRGLRQSAAVIPAKAGIQTTQLDSRLRGNDAVRRVVLTVLFFHVTCFGWLLFFAKGVSHVGLIVRNLFQTAEPVNDVLIQTVLLFGVPLMMFDILRERCATESEPIFKSRAMRLGAYAFGIAVLVLCGVFRSTEFIYFQF